MRALVRLALLLLALIAGSSCTIEEGPVLLVYGTDTLRSTWWEAYDVRVDSMGVPTWDLLLVPCSHTHTTPTEAWQY